MSAVLQLVVGQSKTCFFYYCLIDPMGMLADALSLSFDGNSLRLDPG